MHDEPHPALVLLGIVGGFLLVGMSESDDLAYVWFFASVAAVAVTWRSLLSFLFSPVRWLFVTRPQRRRQERERRKLEQHNAEQRRLAERREREEAAERHRQLEEIKRALEDL